MKLNRFLISFTSLLLVSCSPKVELEPPRDSTIIAEPLEALEHFTVDAAELVDRTEPEEHLEHISYGEGNGKLLSYSETAGKRSWLRKFITTIQVQTYHYPQKQYLYDSPNGNNIVAPFATDRELSSTEMAVVDPGNREPIECWIMASNGTGSVGWVYVGPIDPYANDYWAIIGSVEVDGRKLLLRGYENMFSIWGQQAALSIPSTSGRKLRNPLRTDENSQINFKSICITDETYQGKYLTEHWVKVRDSYGRIGWFPGDSLDVERGGPKYYSPENLIAAAFYEP